MTRKRGGWFLCVALALASLWPAGAADLVILHSNDSHGLLRSSDGTADGAVGGLARVATQVRRVREECPGRVLTLHAGDVLSRGDEVTVAEEGRINFRLMRRIGYDAFTPGNGDFYTGVDRILGLERLSRIDFVHANVRYKDDGRTLFSPYVVKRVAGLRVGILGLGLVRMEHPSAEPLVLDDYLETARQWVPVLRDRADLVVALTHIGHAADLELAAQVPGIDIVVGGHSHTEVHEPVLVPRPDGQGVVPVVQAGDHDRFLGRLDVTLDRAPEGVRVVQAEGRLIPLDASVAPDAQVRAVVERRFRALEKAQRRAKKDQPERDAAA